MQTDPLIGRTFDEKYRIEERLGAGGMGAVYRATHLRLEKLVALKVMNPRLLESNEARARFLREARTAGRVQHPNAVNVTDYGETEDGHVYLVMDYLEGASLRQIIVAEAPLDPARAVSLMLQVSAAVAAAHDAGVLHRDLKPSNIFIEQNKDAPPQVRLLDFGIAKLVKPDLEDEALHHLTQGGTVMGTPRYMSPEQSDGVLLTPASDVYSLGVILYEMLTGEPPFNGNAMSLIIKHATELPRPLREIVPAVPPALAEITLHALAKNPANRPAHAGLFRNQLFATAERLGLEHARADLQMALEHLKDEGLESPSGRFVIGIEKLREHRAANHQAEETAPSPAVPLAAADVPPRAAVTGEILLRQTVPTTALAHTPVTDTPPPVARPVKWRKGIILSVTAVTLLGIGSGLATMLRPPVDSQPAATQPLAPAQPSGLNTVIIEDKGSRGTGVTPAPPAVNHKLPELVVSPGKKAAPRPTVVPPRPAANANQSEAPLQAQATPGLVNGKPLNANADSGTTTKSATNRNLNNNSNLAGNNRNKPASNASRRAKLAAKANSNLNNGATRPRAIVRRGS